MNLSELERVARAMVVKGKGLLAADESSGTIKRRFDVIKLESTEEHRRSYREMLFTAPGASSAPRGLTAKPRGLKLVSSPHRIRGGPPRARPGGPPRAANLISRSTTGRCG